MGLYTMGSPKNNLKSLENVLYPLVPQITNEFVIRGRGIAGNIASG